MSAPHVGQPEWYDVEIDWLATHAAFEQRRWIRRLLDARNDVARRYGKPERALPLHVSWYLMVDMRISYLALVTGDYAQSAEAHALTRSRTRRR